MTIPRNLSFLAQGASSTGVLSVPYGGTGLTTLTAGYIPYGNGTGAFNSGSSLQYTSNGNGFSLAVASGGTWPEFSYQSSINLGNSGYGTFTARGGTTLFGSNFYVNSGAGYSYKNTDYASFLQFTNGQVQFITGPSGTAGTSISASQPMTVFPSGGVSIGNTTDPGATNLSVTGTGKYGTTVSVGAATPAASGAGITFPATQSASTNANTLDDYEEGTWTPGFATGWTTAPTVAYATYTKVGNLVSVFLFYYYGVSTAAATITGLPFASSSTCVATGVSYDSSPAQAQIGAIVIGVSSSTIGYYKAYAGSLSFMELSITYQTT